MVEKVIQSVTANCGYYVRVVNTPWVDKLYEAIPSAKNHMLIKLNYCKTTNNEICIQMYTINANAYICSLYVRGTVLLPW